MTEGIRGQVSMNDRFKGSQVNLVVHKILIFNTFPALKLSLELIA